jgi:hypothetical protein
VSSSPTDGVPTPHCTAGAGTLDAARAAGEANLRGKILIDVSNSLDFSKGMPPALFTGNIDSLGEQLQRAFPDTRVVKALNTVNAAVMVDARQLAGGDHDIFVSGNDAAVKARVGELLRDAVGWKNVVDLGDISTARGTESYLALWVRLTAPRSSTSRSCADGRRPRGCFDQDAGHGALPQALYGVQVALTLAAQSEAVLVVPGMLQSPVSVML